jgi:hypothetical protein
MEQDYHDVAKQSWRKSSCRNFSQKTRYLVADLRKWRRAKPRNSDLLAQIENQILDEQSKPPAQQDQSLQQQLTEQHQDLLTKEETYHIQRAKKKWATQGDRNTSFFYRAIVKRNRKNRITHLINTDGSHSTTPEQISSTLLNYFKTIFTSHNHSPSPNVSFPVNVSDFDYAHDANATNQGNDIYQFTYSIPDITEIYTIVRQMRNTAAPGPDGLNVAFYKSAWEWIKEDIHKVITDFYANAYIPLDLNKTYLSLIPKKTQPNVPQDYRPISLCNVAYKIISKSLANRLKPHLPNYIDQAQSAFIEQRHISSNIIVTQEIIHSFNLKSWKDHAFILKIDLAKAFDRLEWNFILAALHRKGFNDNFINLIHACISTPNFAVLVNDEPSETFRSTRGLRQGCPLSPYLFVLAINELSIRLQEALHSSNLDGIKLGPGCPAIHSLLFADDLILCGKANTTEAQTIKNILSEFCLRSGQCPNFQKSSILFSKNVPPTVRHQIKSLFPVADLHPNTMHLGHPMVFSHRDKNKAYDFIYKKYWAKFGTIKANNLNHAGRLQYIKSVLSSIPIYYMSTVLFSKSFIEKINSIIKRFWWAGVQDDDNSSPIAYRSWEDICKPIEHGGLGVRDLQTVNKSLIMQSAWNIVTNKNPFLSNVLKAKYYSNESFWNATYHGPRSIFWSSILQVRDELTINSIYQIHAGNSSIWSAPWNPIWATIHDHLTFPVTTVPLPATVSDLWLLGTRSWNVDLLTNTFSNQATHSIISTHPIMSNQDDILRWIPAKDGRCSTKAIYKHLTSQQNTPLPNFGSRSISTEANRILQKVWKSKKIPPILKTFAWRLIRHALATGERAGRYSIHIDQHCSHCGAIENDFHLFFQCELPKSVWATTNPPFLVHNILPEQNGVQVTLPILLTTNPSDDLLCKFLFILWYIWKARNDNRFQRRTWTSWQVHQRG